MNKTTSEIEMELQARLDSINAQCEFVIANSENVGLVQFAEIIKRITNQTL